MLTVNCYDQTSLLWYHLSKQHWRLVVCLVANTQHVIMCKKLNVLLFLTFWMLYLKACQRMCVKYKHAGIIWVTSTCCGLLVNQIKSMWHNFISGAVFASQQAGPGFKSSNWLGSHYPWACVGSSCLLGTLVTQCLCLYLRSILVIGWAGYHIATLTSG